MEESSLNAALRKFEAVEANLGKAEKVLAAVDEALPNGVAFMGDDPAYEDNCRAFGLLTESLPPIDGWKPEIVLMDPDVIALSRLDAQELGEIDAILSVERQISEPARLLREYRARFNAKRRALVRAAINRHVDAVGRLLQDLAALASEAAAPTDSVANSSFESIAGHVAEIDTLLGSMARPARWHDLRRHLRFALQCDLRDILTDDWPAVRAGLRESLYGEKEPIPVAIEDLGLLVSAKPSGPVAAKLWWDRLSPEDFERLVFILISSEHGYENPEWLMKTNAPDRGRDLQVHRVHVDPLSGVMRQRVIIQCRHWLSRSVNLGDIGSLRDQMKLWEPPRVDVHVVTTSGRFTHDAVEYVDRHNQSDSALRLELWPDSHLEMLLASRPSIIAEFGLR